MLDVAPTPRRRLARRRIVAVALEKRLEAGLHLGPVRVREHLVAQVVRVEAVDEEHVVGEGHVGQPHEHAATSTGGVGEMVVKVSYGTNNTGTPNSSARARTLTSG